MVHQKQDFQVQRRRAVFTAAELPVAAVIRLARTLLPTASPPVATPGLPPLKAGPAADAHPAAKDTPPLRAMTKILVSRRSTVVVVGARRSRPVAEAGVCHHHRVDARQRVELRPTADELLLMAEADERRNTARVGVSRDVRLARHGDSLGILRHCMTSRELSSSLLLEFRALISIFVFNAGVLLYFINAASGA